MQGFIKFYFNILLFNCLYLPITLNKSSCVLVHFFIVHFSIVYTSIL